jgi:hypothetical protein
MASSFSSSSSSSGLLFAFLFCFLFFVCCLPKDVSVLGQEVGETTRIGVGTSSIGQQIHQWIFSFSARYFDIAKGFVYYQSAFDIQTDLWYLSYRFLAFVSMDRYLNSTLREMVISSSVSVCLTVSFSPSPPPPLPLLSHFSPSFFFSIHQLGITLFWFRQSFVHITFRDFQPSLLRSVFSSSSSSSSLSFFLQTWFSFLLASSHVETNRWC